MLRRKAKGAPSQKSLKTMEDDNSDLEYEGDVENIVRVLDVAIINPNLRAKEVVITLVAVDWKDDEDDQGHVIQWDAEWKLPKDICNLNHLVAECRSSKLAHAGRYSILDEFVCNVNGGGRFKINTAMDSLNFFKYGDQQSKNVIQDFDSCFETAQEIARARLEVLTGDVGETPVQERRPKRKLSYYVEESFLAPEGDIDDLEENCSIGNVEHGNGMVMEERALTLPLPSFREVLNQDVALALDSIPLKELQRRKLQDFVEASVLPLVQHVKFSTVKDAFDLVPVKMDLGKKNGLACFDIKMICTLCQRKVKVNRKSSWLQWDTKTNEWMELKAVQLWDFSAARHVQATSCKGLADQLSPRPSTRGEALTPLPTFTDLVSTGNNDVRSFTTPVAASVSWSKYDSGEVFSVVDLLKEEGHGHKLVEMWKRCCRTKFQQFLASVRKAQGNLIQEREKASIEGTIVKCLPIYLSCEQFLPYLRGQALFPGGKDSSAIPSGPGKMCYHFGLDFTPPGGGAVDHMSVEHLLLMLFQHLKEKEALADGMRYYFRDQTVKMVPGVSDTIPEGARPLICFQAAGGNASQPGQARNPNTVKTHMVHHVYFLQYLLQETPQLTEQQKQALMEVLLRKAKEQVRSEKSKLLFARFQEFVLHSELMFLFMETVKEKYLQFSALYGSACQILVQAEGAVAAASSSALDTQIRARCNLQLLKKTLFEDPVFVQQHLAAFMVVVLFEIGCQRPQVFHGCVYIQQLLMGQFLSQTSDSFVSGVMEESPGRFRFVICGDKVQSYAAPISPPISDHGAAVFRIFVLLHQYWRNKYFEQNLGPYPFLKGSSNSAKKIFHPMFLQVVGSSRSGEGSRSRSRANNGHPLKAMTNTESFSLVQKYISSGAGVIESLDDVVARVVGNDEDKDKESNRREVPVEDEMDGPIAVGVELEFDSDSDEEDVFSEEEVAQMRRQTFLQERQSQPKGNKAVINTAAWEKLDRQHYQPHSGGPIFSGPTAAANQKLQSLKEFFYYVSGHRIMRVYYVEWKCFVFGKDPAMLENLAPLQRHSLATEASDYAPFAIQNRADQAKLRLGVCFGQDPILHYRQNPLAEATRQHVARMEEKQPMVTSQALVAIARLKALNSCSPEFNCLKLDILHSALLDLLKCIRTGNWNQEAVGIPVMVPLPMLMGDIIPVFRLADTPSIVCPKCLSYCTWLDLKDISKKQQIQAKLLANFPQIGSTVWSAIESKAVDLAFMFFCPLNAYPECPLQCGFVTKQHLQLVPEACTPVSKPIQECLAILGRK
jgi:hypothetical protein